MKKFLLIAICFLMIVLSACSSDEKSNISDDVTSSSVETDSTSTKQESINNDIDAEFKAAMDSYEAFFDEYVAFMKKYSQSNGTDMSLLNDYTAYMGKYADTMAKFEALKEADLSVAETSYYVEVQSRITKKLLEVTQ